MHRTTALPLHLLIVVWLLLDIGQFKPVMFPAVLGFEPYAEQHGDDAAACEDHHRKRIVVGCTESRRSASTPNPDSGSP